MIKKLLPLAGIALCLNAYSQSFVTGYDFASVTMTSGTTDPTPPPTLTGLTFGSFSAVGTDNASSGPGRFSFTGWPTGSSNNNDVTFTGAISTNSYYDVMLTPQSGYQVTLNKITFGARRSGTGIRHFAVRSSADGYANNLPASITNATNQTIVVQGGTTFFWLQDTASNAYDRKGQTITLSGGSFTNFTSPLHFRFYAWNAEANTGTFSIDSVRFYGVISTVTGIGTISQDLNNALSVYPVPSTDGIVYVEAPTLQYTRLRVFDVLGSMITESAPSDKKLKLDLSAMPTGTYFIQVSTTSGVVTKKILITK